MQIGVIHLKTLGEYCSELGWDISELARKAGINWRTAQRALDGDVVNIRSARDIARAISEAKGETINVPDIRGLMIRH